jgi:hypothetical protein
VRPGQRLHAGIYQRFGFAFGSAIKPVLIFVPGVTYTWGRFKFFELGEKLAAARFPSNFQRAFITAQATAR